MEYPFHGPRLDHGISVPLPKTGPCNVIPSKCHNFVPTAIIVVLVSGNGSNSSSCGGSS